MAERRMHKNWLEAAEASLTRFTLNEPEALLTKLVRAADQTELELYDTEADIWGILEEHVERIGKEN